MASLHQTVARLRRALPDDSIRRTRHGYVLTLPDGVLLDDHHPTTAAPAAVGSPPARTDTAPRSTPSRCGSPAPAPARRSSDATGCSPPRSPTPRTGSARCSTASPATARAGSSKRSCSNCRATRPSVGPAQLPRRRFRHPARCVRLAAARHHPAGGRVDGRRRPRGDHRARRRWPARARPRRRAPARRPVGRARLATRDGRHRGPDRVAPQHGRRPHARRPALARGLLPSRARARARPGGDRAARRSGARARPSPTRRSRSCGS